MRRYQGLPAEKRPESEIYHFCLKDQERMEFLEFGRSTQDFLGYIELPGEAIGIPHWQVVDVK